MANSLAVLAPKYVAPADWMKSSIEIQGILSPTYSIPRTGLYTTSQAELDDIVENALDQGVALVYLDIPPLGFTDDPRFANPNAYYPTPALLAEMIAAAQEIAAGDPAEWLDGTGAPASVLGTVGDWYIDTSTGQTYKKTNSTTWTAKVDLMPPAGPFVASVLGETDDATIVAALDARYATASQAPVLNARSYGATGDPTFVADTVLDAWMDDLVAFNASGLTTGIEGYLPPGIHRIQNYLTLRRRDSAVPLTIRGSGGRQTYLFGDFVGPGRGIIDLSNENATSYSTGGHRISGIGFLGRGTAGDPVGLLLLNSFENVVADIDAPAGGTGGVPASWPNNATGAPLANSVILVTNDNNSKFHTVRSQGGWQPKAFDSSAVTVSFTSGANTVTASGAFFTAGMTGKQITFASGSDTSTNAIWRATFTYVSATSGTLDINAPSTASGVKFTMSTVRGSITTGTNSLVLDDVVGLSGDYVGMQVHVVGASQKSDASNNAGLLSTTITAVNAGTKTLTLADNATNPVASGEILFCPAVFVGSFEGDPSGRQTNHSWWSDLHTEGFSCAGLILNKAIYTTIKNLKIHGAPYSTASDWGECLYGAYISEPKQVSLVDVQAAYGIRGSKIAIVASRGIVNIDNLELANLIKDVAGVQCSNMTDEFRLVLGNVLLTYPVTAFASTYLPYSAGKQQHIVARGTVTHRDKQGKGTMTPGVVTRGVTSVEGAVIITDDSVYTFKPPGTFGILHVATQTANVAAILNYRTSDDGAGVLCSTIYAGSLTDVLTTASTLTGTTGTDGRVTIACDSSGQIRIENRRGFTIRVAALPSPYGT